MKKLLQHQNLSNALRKEVITFITAGLVTAVRVTAWETNKRNTNPHNTYDDDFDGESFPDFGDQYRDDTETHPALQLFPQQPGSGQILNDNTKIKKFSGYHVKANTYAGFLLDNNWNRKLSRSRTKKSTDDVTIDGI